MSKQKKKGLVPALRFPEFRGKGEWKWVSEKFGEVCKFVRGPFGGALKKEIFVKEGYAVYEQSHAIYQNFDEFRYYINKEKFNALKHFAVKPNDLIMSCSGTMGKFAVVPSQHKEGVINQALLKLTVKKEYNLDFVKYTLEHPLNQEKLLSQSAGGAIKNVVGVGQLKETDLLMPSTQEQQKIAACLTSIDGLIITQTQKLDTLKAHKKGLMQQLFPAQGETVPKLRFPEFRGKGEWEERNFYDLLVEVLDFRGRTPTKLGMDWGGGNIVSLSANNVKNGRIDFNAECNLGSDALYEKWMGKVNLEQGDIVFTMEAPLGNALLVPDSNKYILSQRVVAFKTKHDVNNSFLIQLIWSDKFQAELIKLSTGSTAKGINQKTLKKVDVRFPRDEEEQQKIAACLTSIDGLIAAQTQKLDTLKAHKKGLMQQLFPAMDAQAEEGA